MVGIIQIAPKKGDVLGWNRNKKTHIPLFMKNVGDC